MKNQERYKKYPNLQSGTKCLINLSNKRLHNTQVQGWGKKTVIPSHQAVKLVSAGNTILMFQGLNQSPAGVRNKIVKYDTYSQIYYKHSSCQRQRSVLGCNFCVSFAGENCNQVVPTTAFNKSLLIKATLPSLLLGINEVPEEGSLKHLFSSQSV